MGSSKLTSKLLRRGTVITDEHQRLIDVFMGIILLDVNDVY
jgi:hypothetical protein